MAPPRNTQPVAKKGIAVAAASEASQPAEKNASAAASVTAASKMQDAQCPCGNPGCVKQCATASAGRAKEFKSVLMGSVLWAMKHCDIEELKRIVAMVAAYKTVSDTEKRAMSTNANALIAPKVASVFLKQMGHIQNPELLLPNDFAPTMCRVILDLRIKASDDSKAKYESLKNAYDKLAQEVNGKEGYRAQVAEFAEQIEKMRLEEDKHRSEVLLLSKERDNAAKERDDLIKKMEESAKDAGTLESAKQSWSQEREALGLKVRDVLPFLFVANDAHDSHQTKNQITLKTEKSPPKHNVTRSLGSPTSWWSFNATPRLRTTGCDRRQLISSRSWGRCRARRRRCTGISRTQRRT